MPEGLAPDRIEIGGGILRRWSVADAELLESEIDESRSHLGAWMSFANSDQRSVRERRAWIRSTEAEWEQASAYAYAIAVEERIVGGCSLHSFDAGGARLGYWIGSRFTRKGLGSSAAAGLLNAAEALGLKWVEIRTDEANEPSRRIAEGLGFRLLRLEEHPLDAPAQTGTSVVYRLELSP